LFRHYFGIINTAFRRQDNELLAIVMLSNDINLMSIGFHSIPAFIHQLSHT